MEQEGGEVSGHKVDPSIGNTSGSGFCAPENQKPTIQIEEFQFSWPFAGKNRDRRRKEKRRREKEQTHPKALRLITCRVTV